MTREEQRKRRAEIRLNHKLGVSVEELSKRYYLSFRTVYEICQAVRRGKRGKYKRTKPSNSLKMERNRTIFNRYLDGESSANLALEFDISRQRVDQIVKDVRERDEKEQLKRQGEVPS